jgi:hypothetical protein
MKVFVKKTESLIKLFYELTNIEIRGDDLVGKIHLILLKILGDEETNNILINNIGLSKDSYAFLVDNLNKILKNYDNKNVIIVENTFSKPDFKYLKK